MELAQRVLGVDANRPVQRLQRRLRLLQGVLHLQGAARTQSVSISSGGCVGTGLCGAPTTPMWQSSTEL